jgi:hypothetical protein
VEIGTNYRPGGKVAMRSAQPGPRPAAEPKPAPQAAAIVGILFAALFIAGIVLLRQAVPADPHDPGTWLAQPSYRGGIQVALHLVPFIGITFLWFMAVLRARIGLLEDQFFGTVFLGSGLLFVATLFAAGAVSSGLVTAVDIAPDRLAGSDVYAVARATSYSMMNVFGIKMAGVFMFVTSAIGLRTAIFPRPLAFAGYGLGAVLLLAITDFPWIALVFPLWVLLISLTILLANFRTRGRAKAPGAAAGAPTGWPPRR